MHVLADLAYTLLAVLLLPYWVYRRIRRGRLAGRWAQRRGFVPARIGDVPAIWIHAVSVGEINATRSLIPQLRQRWPDLHIIVSCTTATGLARAEEIYPDLTVIAYPLDFSWMVRRALDRLRPTVIVLVELELWFNLALAASRRGIPIVVINGRLSERSLRRYRLIRPLARVMFSRLAGVHAQTEQYAERFCELGAPRDRVQVAGNLKFDTAEGPDSSPLADELAACMSIDRARPILVAGSTGPGEESALLSAYRELVGERPQWQLVLVPRRPERFDEVAQLIEQAGFAVVRRSAPKERPQAAPDKIAVFLGDTMGELRGFYSMASAVFVGRSLVAMGGSDVMEPAALAKPICVGPHTENFADAVARLREPGGLVVVQSAAEVMACVRRWQDDPQAAQALAERARQAVLANRGATQRAVELLAQWLQVRRPTTDAPASTADLVV
jgi:3-deoxy-D-manno-octulosonic-acid transferase